MKNILKISILLFISSIHFATFAQKKEDKSAKIKTVFTYNFTNYITWPTESSSGTFKIGVINNITLFEELKKMEKVKKIANREIEVTHLKNLDEITNFHIVYVSDKNTFPLNDIYKILGNKPVLLVTDEYNQNEVMIDFRKKGKEQKFALNEEEFKNRNLQVDPILSNLAIPIKSDK
ncbi:MAG: YfiR family protein [Bacteroidetes bacterium]|nr:MAG: YfiR family protein [Bacteroidota bacterium]MBL1145024.1 YfiR family protein [Bacteroidota bacterium]NOG57821.1 YfiR family protein [Bacteroidota bacterium]